MVGLTSLEVYNCVLNITEGNNKIEFFFDNFDEFSFAELKSEIEDVLDLLDLTPKHLQHE